MQKARRPGRAGRQDHSPHARHGQKERPQPAAGPLPELVDEARAFADIEAQRTGTQIVGRHTGKFAQIVVDRIMIEQVLLNLVKNGIEAMHDIPFERRHLTIQARRLDERMLEVAVADQGHGCRKRMSKRFLPPFTPPSRRAWASGWRSAARLSSFTRAGYGSKRAATAARLPLYRTD
jgi:nitrogen fixation/metabolism regulation signal transduction histidine kinase